MSITDELREYAGNFYLFRYKDVREKLDAIADRIDAEYQKVIRELNNFADASVLLPVDADGEYIHIGDKVTLYGRCVYEVDAIYLHKDRVSVSYSGESGCGCDSANNFHHYHEPTVEDVLAEFFEQVGDGLHTLEAMDTQLIIAKYAAKLRLAGDAVGPNELALAYHVGFDDALAKRKPDANKVVQR